MKNNLLKTALVFFVCFTYSKIQAQVTPQPEVNFTIGQFVSAQPDSLFKATVDVSVDTIQAKSIRLVVQDSSVVLSDVQYTLVSLPVIQSDTAWKENNIIHISISDYNPFRKRNYLVELLGENGQLLLQIEKEF